MILVAVSETRKRANAAYNRRQDNIMIRPSKKVGAQIRAAAAAEGKSVQRFILDILEDHLGIAQGDDNTADS